MTLAHALPRRRSSISSRSWRGSRSPICSSRSSSFPRGVIPRDVKVPNVTGLDFDEAAQRLAQAGFKAEQGEQRYNNSAPKMTVLEQSPPPGAREGVGARSARRERRAAHGRPCRPSPA